MQFSPQQNTIFEWVENAQNLRHQSAALVIEAVAGSGKTTTIVEAARYVKTSGRCVFLAFNKSIATTLASRLPDGWEASTLNALGFNILRKQRRSITVDAKKTLQICADILPPHAKYFHHFIAQVVSKCKALGFVPRSWGSAGNGSAFNEETFEFIIDHFGIVRPEYHAFGLYEFANKVLQVGIDNWSTIDFDDQIYLPVILGLPGIGYEWIVVDEAQDVSAVQRMLIDLSLADAGKLIAVGDSRQAIYGFRGAASESMADIVRMFDADRLPLSVTYRCPRSVVELAQTVVPQIECPPTAKVGAVETPESWSFADFRPTDLVMCRNVAPLVSLAYALIGEGIGCFVAGRDIGEGLKKHIAKIAKKTNEIDEFVDRLAEYRRKEMAKAVAKDDDALIQSIDDRCSSIEAIIAEAEPVTVEDLIRSVTRIFEAHDDGSLIKLSTIHKAKGLEAERAIIYAPSLIPSVHAKKEWQRAQEENLFYVAVTRALDTLIFLEPGVIQ